MIDTAKTDLAGVSQDTLKKWLSDAQTAMHDLVIGGKPVQVTYVQGDGQKSVTYTKADMAGLRGYIQELKLQLGITCGRAPMRPFFNGR